MRDFIVGVVVDVLGKVRIELIGSKSRFPGSQLRRPAALAATWSFVFCAIADGRSPRRPSGAPAVPVAKPFLRNERRSAEEWRPRGDFRRLCHGNDSALRFAG